MLKRQLVSVFSRAVQPSSVYPSDTTPARSSGFTRPIGSIGSGFVIGLATCLGLVLTVAVPVELTAQVPVAPGALAPLEPNVAGPAGSPVAPVAGGGLKGFQTIVDSLNATPQYVRERFDYPTAGRIDPVTPPTSLSSANAFPDLELTGIIYDPKNPLNSRAMVRFSGSRAARQLVRAGDQLDQYQVVAVEQARVVIDARYFGQVRRIYLEAGGRDSRPAAAADSEADSAAPGRGAFVGTGVGPAFGRQLLPSSSGTSSASGPAARPLRPTGGGGKSP